VFWDVPRLVYLLLREIRAASGFHHDIFCDILQDIFSHISLSGRPILNFPEFHHIPSKDNRYALCAGRR
jgi:hypothetical protein